MVDTPTLPNEEDREFLDLALARAKELGEAALLLVGSRAAGYDDSWSDLDLWIIADKAAFSDSEKKEYELTGQVFVDRGDFEAHYSVYDRRDIERRLRAWADVHVWLIQNCRPLYDPAGIADGLMRSCSRYPDDILEEKLRWWYLTFVMRQASLGLAGRRIPVGAVFAATDCMSALCRMCCLADGLPFPYAKWLRRAAGQTRLGKVVCPAIDEACDTIGELVHPPEDLHYRQLRPVKALKSLMQVLPDELRKLGWSAEWIDKPTDYFWVILCGEAP